MDFASLSAFVAVADTGSFSRASERLFMTQPAVSKRIAALEEDLGVTLFDRLGRGIRLTEAGQTFLSSARRILSDIQLSRDELLSIANEVGGRLQLATSHHVGIHRLPPVLKSFTQRYPDVDLDLLFMDSELACEEVLSGRIELAVVTLPDKLEKCLLTELIWPDPLGIVCAPDHRLAQSVRSGQSIDAQALVQHSAVLPAHGTVTRAILLEALRPFDVSVETALETNYLETIKVMVSVGLGWSALPSTMEDDSIVSIPVQNLQMQRRLGLVCLRGRTLSRAAMAFTKLLRS